MLDSKRGGGSYSALVKGQVLLWERKQDIALKALFRCEEKGEGGSVIERPLTMGEQLLAVREAIKSSLVSFHKKEGGRPFGESPCTQEDLLDLWGLVHQTEGDVETLRDAERTLSERVRNMEEEVYRAAEKARQTLEAVGQKKVPSLRAGVREKKTDPYNLIVIFGLVGGLPALKIVLSLLGVH